MEYLIIHLIASNKKYKNVSILIVYLLKSLATVIVRMSEHIILSRYYIDLHI